MAHQAHDAIDVHSPLVLHDAAASPHGSPVLGSSNNNNNSSSSNNLTTTAIPYEDSPEVPHSPSFGNNNATFAYTPTPSEEYTDKQLGAGGALHSSDVEYGVAHSQNKRTLIGGNLFHGKRKWYWIGGGILLLAVVVGATVGGIKGSKKSTSSSPSKEGIKSNGASTNNPLQAADPSAPIGNTGSIGRNGTIVTMENGQTFTYINNYGGYFVDTPYDDSAKAQSYTPALNESWDYTTMK